MAVPDVIWDYAQKHFGVVKPARQLGEVLWSWYARQEGDEPQDDVIDRGKVITAAAVAQDVGEEEAFAQALADDDGEYVPLEDVERRLLDKAE